MSKKMFFLGVSLFFFCVFLCCWVLYPAQGQRSDENGPAMSASTVTVAVGLVDLPAPNREPQEEVSPKVTVLSAVDQKLEKLGFGNSADVQKINVNVTEK